MPNLKTFKSSVGRILKKLLPLKIYKLIANGFIIVPKYYKPIIEETENFHDISLQESYDKDFMLMKKYGHILDKGLHRVDIEPGHSKQYYEDLKLVVNRLASTDYAKDPSYQWAKDKLTAYELLQNNPKEFKPLKGNRTESILSYDELFELIKQRRSNRYFQEKEIPDEIIRKLKCVGNWAASSCNKQPIRVFVTNNPTLASECLKCCAGGTGFGEFIPSFWVFTANTRAYVYPTEMFLPSVDTSLGAQNVFLAAQTLGLSGTILTWAQHTHQDDLKLRNLLDIPSEYSIIFCAVMGYSKFEYSVPLRKETDV